MDGWTLFLVLVAFAAVGYVAGLGSFVVLMAYRMRQTRLYANKWLADADRVAWAKHELPRRTTYKPWAN